MEANAARELDWFKLSEAERQVLPIGMELDRLEAEIHRLYDRRREEFEALAEAAGAGLPGVAAKLAVAEKMLAEENSEVAALVGGALTELVAAQPALGRAAGRRRSQLGTPKV